MRESREDSWRLTRSRSELDALFQESIARGEELLQRDIFSHGRHPSSDEHVKAVAAKDMDSWDEYNKILLKRVFTSEEELQGYPTSRRDPNPLYSQDRFRELIEERVEYLRYLHQQLGLYDEPSREAATRIGRMNSTAGSTIFIVHGHREGPKQEVARYLETVTTLKPAILHDLPKSGRTIIEGLEQAAASALFAVVLLTADDKGTTRNSSEWSPRARQNVVFELGLFIGTLGRARVAVLYEQGVELPSDMNGILYTPLDSAGAWKLSLGRELLAAGIAVDLNRAV